MGHAVHEPFTPISGSCLPLAMLIGAGQCRRKLNRRPFNEHGPNGTTEQVNEATLRRRAMRKTLLAIAAAATLVVASVAAPQQAEAGGRGGAIAAGIIGGIAAGALIGGALASQPRYYYYEPGPAYYYRPRCFWSRERYWNGWRWRSHRVRVCE
jgi:MFS family permease